MLQQLHLNHFIPIATEEDRPGSRLLPAGLVLETSPIAQEELCALFSSTEGPWVQGANCKVILNMISAVLE